MDTKESLSKLTREEMRARAKDLQIALPNFMVDAKAVDFVWGILESRAQAMLKAQEQEANPKPPDAPAIAETTADAEQVKPVQNVDGPAPTQSVTTIETEKTDVPPEDVAPTEHSAEVKPDATKTKIPIQVTVKPSIVVRSYLGLRALARSLGISKKVVDADEMQTQIKENSDTPTEETIYWDGAIDASDPSKYVAWDPEGNWGAVVFDDGKLELTMYATPNLLNRVKGTVSAQDVTIIIPNFADFADRLYALHAASGDAIEASLLEQAEQEAVRQVELDGDGPAAKPTFTIDKKMTEAAKEFGLLHVASGDLPFFLADALGVEFREPIIGSDGNPALNAAGHLEFGGRLPFDEVVDRVQKALQPQ